MALAKSKYVGASLVGLEKLTSRLTRAAAVVRKNTDRALHDFAVEVLEYALPLTPIDHDGPHPGLLRSSQFGPIMTSDKNWTYAQIGYDAGIAHYGIYVHEIAEQGGKWHHEPPTQWKFLQKAVTDLSDHLGQKIALAVFFAVENLKSGLR